ncbi:NADAR family protein [Caenispirillum salinarum]|uniref:NADAR family protein n=1 Tax=Caenispirillum salinarum TaxID=859058 RepID=UPI00384C0786
MSAGAEAGAAPAVIDDFAGDFFWLSNFFPCPVELDGALYITVENAFQAAKTLDLAARAAFETCGPDEAKMRGMAVALRPDWEAAKVSVMEALLREKFAIPALARRLKATGTAEIVNRNVFGDTFWGVTRGQGRNELGKALMRVREGL